MKHRTGIAPFMAAIVALIAMGACSQPSSTPPAAPATAEATQSPAGPAAATAAVAAEPELPVACDMVTASEMSAIVGGEVTAQPNEGSSGKTECIYTAVKGISPYVELSVEWGEGELAMKSVGAMSQVEPGISNPYEGIGDQAAAVGTSLMIRTGPDLMTITFSGVENAPAAAKKIFDTAKARM